MDDATPRVNFEAMQRFQGRQVLLVGEILSINNGQLLVKTSDDAQVSVVCNPSNSGSYDDKFVEVSVTTAQNHIIALSGLLGVVCAGVHTQ